jgi:hypothetical protein
MRSDSDAQQRMLAVAINYERIANIAADLLRRQAIKGAPQRDARF